MEDVGLYRDALGTAPPTGVPQVFLAPVDDALLKLHLMDADARRLTAEQRAAIQNSLEPLLDRWQYDLTPPAKAA